MIEYLNSSSEAVAHDQVSVRCMPKQHVAVGKVSEKRGAPEHRAGGQRRFLLRAKVDDEDESREEEKQVAPKALQTARLSGQAAGNLIYYSAYTHSASPTYFKWVNLTACEIHRSLTHRPGYTHSWLTAGRGFDRDQPHLLFYLNHPIQFVQVVGIVVNTEEWYERFWLFTVDDSSGHTIDVVCRKPDPKKKDETRSFASEDAEGKQIHEDILKLSQQVQSNVQIGAVLQVKGTITVFQRNRTVDVVRSDLDDNDGTDFQKKSDAVRQISLQRLTLIHDTNAETTLIAARTKFFTEVLSKPWQLSKKEQEKLYRKASGEADRERKRARRRMERLKQVAEEDLNNTSSILAEYEADEKERAVAANKAKEAGQALVGNRETKSLQPRTMPTATGKTVLNKEAESSDPRTRKRKRRSKGMTTARDEDSRPVEATEATMSFGIDDDEKSALLRAAFGF